MFSGGREKVHWERMRKGALGTNGLRVTQKLKRLFVRHNSSWVTMSSDYVYDKSMSRHSHHCMKIKFSIKDLINVTTSAQKMKFSIKDFFSKYDLKKSLMENFIFQCIIDLFSGKIYPPLILKTPNKLF